MVTDLPRVLGAEPRSAWPRHPKGETKMSELRIERVYPIAPADLFAYVTEAQNLLKWWGPEGMMATEVNLDLTRPGPWSLVLDSPRGPFEMRGTVLGVKPPL